MADRWIFKGDVVDFELDARELLGYVDREVRRQFRFAHTLALTWTATDVRNDLRARLPLYFTVRNKFTAGSIQSRRAEMSDPVPFSEVGSVQDYMRLHALGGWREKLGQDKVSIPVRARSPKTRRTTRSTWPGALVGGKGKYVILDLARGSSGLFRMKGRAGTGGLAFMWLLTDKARIAQDWPYESLVERRVAHSWPKLTLKALAKSLGVAYDRVKRRI